MTYVRLRCGDGLGDWFGTSKRRVGQEGYTRNEALDLLVISFAVLLGLA